MIVTACAFTKGYVTKGYVTALGATLEGVRQSLIGKPVTYMGEQTGTVLDAWIENESVMAKVELDEPTK